MVLTKEDLQAIDGLIVKRISPLAKNIKQIEKKFDELFNFLDKKYLVVKRDVRNVQKHLHLPISDF